MEIRWSWIGDFRASLLRACNGSGARPLRKLRQDFQRLPPRQAGQGLAAQGVSELAVHAVDLSVDHRLHRQLGKWSLEHGYNGAFVDWGDVDAGDSKTGRIDWINKFDLRFYMDHLAGKRELHLWDGGIPKNALDRVHGNGVRVNPVNDAMRQRLQKLIEKNIAAVEVLALSRGLRPRRRNLLGPFRASDHVVRHRRRGRLSRPGSRKSTAPTRPQRERWVTYEDIRPKLASWSVKDFDASPLHGPVDVQRFVLEQLHRRPGRVLQQHRSGHALRLGRRPVAERLRRLRLRQDHAQGAVHRVVQHRRLAGDHPLLQPAQRHPGRHQPFPSLGRRHHLADVVLPGARQSRLHRLGREVVRRRQRPSPGTRRSRRTSWKPARRSAR